MALGTPGELKSQIGGDVVVMETRDAQALAGRIAQRFGGAPTVLDGKVHKLAVRLKQPGMTARARRSYLAAAEKPNQ